MVPKHTLYINTSSFPFPFSTTLSLFSTFYKEKMSPFEMNTNCTQMASTSDHLCNTGLSLGLTSFNDGVCSSKKEKSVVSLKFDHVLPALSLGPSDQGSSSSKVSSRRVSSDEDDEEEEEASPRKKLRLTKDQSALLEDIFREHSTLNPSQKHALAKQLNLRPRQVEVWFQNRRARTKLKQTETDCELLKKCCERLTEENKRLKKELSELKSIKMAPLYMQMHSSPTLSICPSCDPSLINAVHHRYPSSANRDQKPVFISGTNPNLFFPHSSAAC